MQHSPPSSRSPRIPLQFPSNSPIPAMDNTTLKHFIVLSETLHFGQASARSSASALSRHIRQLEIELNESLFDRDNRTVQLTVEGLKFQRYARNSAQQWDRPRTCWQLVPDPRRHTKDLRSTCLKRHQRHQRQPGAGVGSDSVARRLVPQCGCLSAVASVRGAMTRASVELGQSHTTGPLQLNNAMSAE